MELKELAPFKSAPQVTEQLQKYGINKSYAEGSVIIQEHNYINSIPIVLSGSIRVMRVDDEGRELLLYYIKAGESCIMSFLSGLHQDTSKIKAIAEEDTELLFVPIEKVSLLIKEFPEWLDYIFKLYHKRFEELLEVVNAVAFKKLDQRLLDFIKNKSSLGNTKEIHITHEQIANELGTARVVISRLLKQLEEEGIIQLGRNKITLV
jgi:CRP/FNR family transcriptional regulator, anaerobic regulatory protein